MKTFVIHSCGLNPVVCALQAHAEVELAGVLSFDCGQHLRKELDIKAACAV